MADLSTGLGTKLDANLGSENENKYLTVNEDGDIVASTKDFFTQTAVEGLLDEKVSIDQGIANAGKFLVVGNDGNVAATEEDFVTPAQLASELEDKLDANLGQGNAGKYLTIGNDGSVSATTKDFPTVSQMQTALGEKLDASLGTTNIGKYLQIGEGGAIEPVTLDAVSSQDLADGLADKLNLNLGSENSGKHLTVSATGDVTVTDLDSVSSGQLQTALAAKLDKSVGSSKAGQYMVVSATGEIIPEARSLATSELLTTGLAEKLDIEQGQTNANKYVVTDHSGNITVEARDLASRDYADAIIKISRNQPVDENTKLWINPDIDETVSIPTTSDLDTALGRKLDTNLGQDNAGKYLTIDNEGKVVAQQKDFLTADQVVAIDQGTNNSGKYLAVDAQGNVAPVELDHVTASQLDAKLNKNLGAANSGKYLAVGQDGEIAVSNTQLASAADLSAGLGGKLDSKLNSSDSGKYLTIGNDGTITPTVKEFPTADQMTTALADKLDIDQGSENQGKHLVVGNDGMVALETPDTVSSSQLSAAVEGKLDKSAGAANSGAFMVVNSSGNIVPEQKTFVTPTALASDLAGKVDVAQGASNANKFLVTDQDGNVVAQAKSLPSREDVDAIVTISSQQPTSDGAKIWINDSNAESAVLVPTTQEMNDALAEKLNANIGSENAGQYLMVDSDGDIIGVSANLATVAEVNEIANAKVAEYQGQQNAGRFLAVGADGNVDLVVPDTVSSSELSDGLAEKLDASAGAANSGKYMMVDTDGGIKPMSPPVVSQTELQAGLAAKVNVAQGTNNAGDFLVVGQDGNVTTETMDLATRDYADGVVKISSQQPTEENNKLWIKTDVDGSVEIPTTADLTSALSTKVDKVTGKTLTSNDFTDGLKALLESVEEDAQENVIETIQVNGTARPVSSKTVNIVVPTSVSDLTNDSGFATLASPQFTGTPTAPTAAAGNASNQIANTAFVANAVNSALSAVYVLKGTKATVADLPTTGNEIGHVWHVSADSHDYFWDGSEWQTMGGMVDLTGYVYDPSYVHTDSNFTAAEKTKLGNIAAYAQVNTIEGIKVNGATASPDIDKVVSITVPTRGSDIGLGRVENKSSADIRGELTKANVTNALGYEPPQYNTTYDALTQADAIAGTDTIAGLISPAVLNAAITNKGYTTNAGTVTGIKMNGSNLTVSNDGTVNLGTVITQHQDLSGKLNANLTSANSGKYLKVDASGDVQPVTLDAVSTGALNSALAGKVDVSQPNANTGDLLAVDSNGNVTAQTINYATQSYADGIIKAGSSEPTDAQTKLWIDTSDVEGDTVYTQAEVDAALGNKVDRVDGKGLSTNDFNDTYLDKLLGVATGAQVNVIETIQLNGSALTPSEKTVNIVVPTPDSMGVEEAKAGAVTTSKLISAKTLDDAIENKGYTRNTGTVTGVKMNSGSAVSPDANGVVDLGTVITAHQDISGKQDQYIGTSHKKKLLAVNTSGNIAVSSITTTDISNLSSNVNGKVAISQGVVNAGKFMVVDQDGNVAATVVTRAIIDYTNGVWQISSTASGTPAINVQIDQPVTGDVYVPTTAQMQTALSSKLNSSFASADAGKFLVVGSNGQITAVTMQQWQAGSY